MAHETLSNQELSDDEFYVSQVAVPPREAWLGKLRYVVVPVIAVVGIVAAIYFLDDGRNFASDQVGASSQVNLSLSSYGAQAPAPKVGSPAADFTLSGLSDGKPVKLSDFRGKTVFLNFFASWCPPCRAEMPDIVATYEEQKANDVVVLAVDMQEEASVVANYASSAGMTFPIVLDRNGTVSGLYRISALPTSFFIDKDGVIRQIQIGAMSKKLMTDNLKKAMQ